MKNAFQHYNSGDYNERDKTPRLPAILSLSLFSILLSSPSRSRFFRLSLNDILYIYASRTILLLRVYPITLRESEFRHSSIRLSVSQPNCISFSQGLLLLYAHTYTDGPQRSRKVRSFNGDWGNKKFIKPRMYPALTTSPVALMDQRQGGGLYRAVNEAKPFPAFHAHYAVL